MRFLICFAFRGELSILPCMLLVWHPLSQVFSKHIQSKKNKRFSVETVAQSEQPHGARETSTAPTSSRFDTLINESVTMIFSSGHDIDDFEVQLSILWPAWKEV